ncbi:hypothetical protein FRC11_001057, partial [Ceratobasidium sp. 423]
MERVALVPMRQTTAGWIIVVLAVVAVVWRRRRRRTRPWLAKLREAARIEREADQEPSARPKEIASEKERPKEGGKRPKERRRRGKESKRPVRAPSPRLVPLPPSPVVPADPLPASIQVMTSPAPSPALPAPKPKLPAFPPPSPLPPSLARKPPPVVRPSPSINTSLAPNKPKAKDEVEFPTRPKPARKPSDAGRRARKPSEAKKSSTPESTQIASLKGALEAARQREEEVAEERKAWQKKERELQTQVNQLSHQLHALTIAFATGGQGFPPYGYPYDPKSESSSEPAVYYSYPQFPLFVPPMTQHGTPITPQHAPMTPAPMTPQAHGPPMVSSPPQPHGTMSPTQPYLVSHPWTYRGPSPMHSPMTMPGINGVNSPAVPMGAVPMNNINGINSPINGIHSPVGMNPARHHWQWYTGSPRRGARQRQGTGTPSTPSVGSVDDAIPLPDAFSAKDTAFPGRDAFVFGKEGLGGRDAAFSLNTKDSSFPRDTTDDYIPPRDDYIPLRDDYVPTLPRPTGIKREREETDDSSLDGSDDEDSVIFEDGSVSDSVNLSLRPDRKERVEL